MLRTTALISACCHRTLRARHPTSLDQPGACLKPAHPRWPRKARLDENSTWREAGRRGQGLGSIRMGSRGIQVRRGLLVGLTAWTARPARAHWRLALPARCRIFQGRASLCHLVLLRCCPGLGERELGLARRASRPALLALRIRNRTLQTPSSHQPLSLGSSVAYVAAVHA